MAPLKHGLILFCILYSSLSFTEATQTNTANTIDSILIGEHRSAKNKARDNYRHPQETLAFFGVTSDMTVVEIWPGGGAWYTEILGPYLHDKGKLYAAHFSADSSSQFYQRSLKKFNDKLAAYPKIYSNIQLTELEPPQKTIIAPKGSADAVLTFRNVHNWIKADTATLVFTNMFDALKPGGILGVVEHRGSESMTEGNTTQRISRSGYVPESIVIKLAEEAGFVLIAQSDINANPLDIKAYPQGVWTLPPSLKLKEVNKKKYLTIGESDRMTIKFKKPLQDK